MVLVGHFVGCFLHFFSIYSASCDALRSNSTYQRPCTWTDLEPFVKRDDFSRYMASLYWAFAAMSTVGYGDLVPVNIGETGAVLVAEFVGVLSFASVMGTVTSLTSHTHRREAYLREKMDFVASYMRENRLKLELQVQPCCERSRRLSPRTLDSTRCAQVRIRKFYEYSLNHKLMPEADVILAELSTSLRECLARELYGEYQDTFPLLQNRTLTFLAWIGPRLQACLLLRE